MEQITDTQDPAPFTPGEQAAPNPLLHRAMNARLEKLLAKHEPTIFPAWVAKMEAEGEGPAVSKWWGQCVLYAAVLMMTRRRDLDRQPPAAPVYDSAFYDTDRRFQRNRDLLIKLVFKGVIRRGEAKRK